MVTENLYAIATSPNMKKKLHHRYVPMMMYSQDGKEVILPVVVGTSREISEAEVNAYEETKKSLGEIALKDQGVFTNPDGSKTSSTWKKLLDAHRAAWLMYFCTRMPDDINKRFFENKEQVFDTYNHDELGILMDHYAVVRFTQPHYTLIDNESTTVFQDVIDKIKAMGEEADFFLNGLTTHSANQLIKYLVSHPMNSENTTGSSGVPSNNTTQTK